MNYEFIRFLQCVTCKNTEKCLLNNEECTPVDERCTSYTADKEMQEIIEEQLCQKEKIPWE